MKKGYEAIEKYTAIILLVMLCMTLIPVMYVGRYNHPTGDDYFYGVETKAVLESGGNAFEVLGEAFRGVVKQYERWQGTYSAMFLMHLPPNVFAEGAYAGVTAVLILLFAAATFYCLKPIVCIWMKGSVYLWLILSSIYVLLCLQTVPFIGESLFWYNGSMYYTGYYAMTMFFIGMLCRYLISAKKYHMPVLVLLALFLAGGNYVSLLPCILIVASITVVLAFLRSKKGIASGILVFCMLAGLAVSAMAPGNQNRQEGLFQMSAIKAILKSLYQGIKYVSIWTGIWWLMAAAFLTPFLWKSFHKITFRFRYPLVVIGLSYGIFCSMACPTFYAMNSTGPARVLAIVYYGLMAFTLFAYYYLLGWIYQWLTKRREEVQRENFRKRTWICFASVFVLFLVVQLATGKVQECSVVRAIKVLESGEAVAYHQEYLERLEILRDDSVQDVVFMPYENQPDMIYVGDFTGDASNVNNVRIAQYWGKNSLRVEYGQ